MPLRFAGTGLQVCGALVAAFWKVQGNGGLHKEGCYHTSLPPQHVSELPDLWKSSFHFFGFYPVPGWEA